MKESADVRGVVINCDMGEWDTSQDGHTDVVLMPFVDLSNIACGGHAGSGEIMRKTIVLAASQDVLVGAHPGYADRENFGRIHVELSSVELYDLLRSQIDRFLGVCDDVDVLPYHIKPHGALYHACSRPGREQDALLEVLLQHYSYLTLVCLAGSSLSYQAESCGLTVLREGFVDRRYQSAHTLMPRAESGAVITDADLALAQYESMISGGVSTAMGYLPLLVDTVCIHSDNPAAVHILELIHEAG